MNAVIVEDEHLIASELVAKINNVAPQIKILEVLNSIKTSKKWLSNHQEPDVWIMDIQLSDGVSFQLIEQYQLQSPVIFTTAYDEFALKAFKTNGIDYLLKPIDEHELASAFKKLEKITNKPTHAEIDWNGLLSSYSIKTPLYKERIILQFRNNWLPIKTVDIACIYKDTITYLYLTSGEKYPYPINTLEEAESFLDPNLFYRANRQTIINLNSIKQVQPLDNQKLLVSLLIPIKFNIEISREKISSFKKWFEK
jgi:DNA-binding LytR/AlgR family response regulator